MTVKEAESLLFAPPPVCTTSRLKWCSAVLQLCQSESRASRTSARRGRPGQVTPLTGELESRSNTHTCRGCWWLTHTAKNRLMDSLVQYSLFPDQSTVFLGSLCKNSAVLSLTIAREGQVLQWSPGRVAPRITSRLRLNHRVDAAVRGCGEENAASKLPQGLVFFFWLNKVAERV